MSTKNGTGYNRIEAPFWVGEFRVEPEIREIKNADYTHRLKPKEWEVLKILVTNSGQVVERSELLEKVWNDSYPNDEGLTQTVSQLRKAFNDDPVNPVYIETIPKKGYRLIESVNFTNKPAGDAGVSNDKNSSKKFGSYLKENVWQILIAALIALLLGIVVYQSFIQEPVIRTRKVKLPIEAKTQ